MCSYECNKSVKYDFDCTSRHNTVITVTIQEMQVSGNNITCNQVLIMHIACLC